jgi:hypothetical protein
MPRREDGAGGRGAAIRHERRRQEDPEPEDRGRRSRTADRRGFAALGVEKRREISRRGGEASHARGTGHEWNEKEARDYGREGGRTAHQRGTAHEWSSREARAAGREGGRARRAGDEDDGEYCPACGRGGRPGRQESGSGRDQVDLREEDGGRRRAARERTGSRGVWDEDDGDGGSRRGFSAIEREERRDLGRRDRRSRIRRD